MGNSALGCSCDVQRDLEWIFGEQLKTAPALPIMITINKLPL